MLMCVAEDPDPAVLSGERQADLAALHPVREHRLRRILGTVPVDRPLVVDVSAMPACTRCGDVIGVYEPAVIVLDGESRVTSRAGEPDAVRNALERYHRACYLDG
jgi:hypothetical protein